MDNVIFRTDDIMNLLAVRLAPSGSDLSGAITCIPIEFRFAPSSGSWGVRAVCLDTGECIHVDLSEYAFERKPQKGAGDFSLEELVFSLLNASAGGLKSEDLVSALGLHGIPPADVLRVIREQTVACILRFDTEFKLKLAKDLGTSLLEWGFYTNGVNKDKTYLRGKKGVAIGRL